MNLFQAGVLDEFSIFPGDWNMTCDMGQLAILSSSSLCRGWLTQQVPLPSTYCL